MKVGITFTGSISIVVDANEGVSGEEALEQAITKIIEDTLRKEEWISDEVNTNLHYEDDWNPKKHQTIMWSKALSPKLKEEMIRACQATWLSIGIDMLRRQPDQSMSAENAREITADYVTASEWWDITHEERAVCLREAIPRDVVL